mmetsp:Transcript_31514/g.52647  ORF Transcript_31514/g.52647 Transcript_31514/m.52647 type:complete len:333 (-) Transcript_31514:337-1335(-)
MVHNCGVCFALAFLLSFSLPCINSIISKGSQSTVDFKNIYLDSDSRVPVFDTNEILHDFGDKKINHVEKNVMPPPLLPRNINELQYHGTTTLAFKCQDSIIVCVDSKASMGNYVGSRSVKKVFPVSPNIVATMAGGAADCAHWIRRISRVSRLWEYKYDAAFDAGAIARLLASSLREYKGAGLSVGTMVAGWSHNNGPSLYYVDSEGTCVEGDKFCVGSGAQLAYAVLDTADSSRQQIECGSTCSSGELTGDDGNNADGNKAEVLISLGVQQTLPLALREQPVEDAIQTAIAAVRHATYRDGYSGGYINVLVINSTGIHHVHRVDSRTIRID